MILFSCSQCGHQIYFESTSCVQCGSMLGYQPDQRAFQAGPAEAGELPALEHCKNRIEHDACNWLLSHDGNNGYCASCALTEVIPNLADDADKQAWKELEAAKRRLLFTLRWLGLPITSKNEDPERGLVFRFLKSTPEEPVTTGHRGGVVTINVAEANAAYRENERERLGEAYRTALGHLRHETGHYYFERLIAGSEQLEPFRALFGDERVSYEEQLERHYASGPPADWQERHVSAYASMHPWEDWAESFAHYLHMVDVLETAQSYGLAVREPSGDGSEGSVVTRKVDLNDFDELIEGFHPVTLALNDLNRSMGLKDAYPFVVSPAARKKLAFIHELIGESRQAAVRAASPHRRTRWFRGRTGRR